MKTASGRQKLPCQKTLAGVEGLFGPAGLTPAGPPFGRYPSFLSANRQTASGRQKLPCQKTLAGVEGFEPPYGGIKTRCLTAWRHPNILQNRSSLAAQRRFIQSLCDEARHLRRNVSQNPLRFADRVQPQEYASAGSGQTRIAKRRQPVQRSTHGGKSTTHRGSAVVTPTFFKEAANCDGRGIPCQFRGLKHFSRAD